MDGVFQYLSVFAAAFLRGLRFIVPDGAGDFWSAVEGLATLGVGIAAWKISRNQFALDLLPVLHAERKQGKTTLTNRGRGLALELFGVKHDGDAEFVAPSLAQDAILDYSHIKLTLTEPHWIYYTDARGTWYRLKLVGSSISGEQPEFNIGAETRRVWRRKLPKSILSRKQRLSRTVVEHYAALVSRFTTEHWRNRTEQRMKEFYLWLGKTTSGVGEAARIAKYRHLADTTLDREPAEEIIRAWDIDLRGISLGCWHTHPIEVEHYAFEKQGDDRVCQIARVRPFPGDPKVPGLVIVTARTWKTLSAVPRSTRNDRLFESLVTYLCRRSSKEFFVCVL